LPQRGIFWLLFESVELKETEKLLKYLISDFEKAAEGKINLK
jgi:hypothetical protein